MLCKQTCATIGKCTCGQWDDEKDLIAKLEQKTREGMPEKIIVISTPLRGTGRFEKMIRENCS